MTDKPRRASLTQDEFREFVSDWLPSITATPQNGAERAEQLRAIYKVGELLNQRLPDRSPYGGSPFAELAIVFGRKQGWLEKVKQFARVYSSSQLDSLCSHAEYMRFSHVQHLLAVGDRRVRAKLQRKAAEEQWSLQRLQNEVRHVKQPSRRAGRKPTTLDDPKAFLLDVIDRCRRWRHLEDASATAIELLSQDGSDLSELVQNTIEEVRVLQKACQRLEANLVKQRRSIRRRISSRIS